MNDPFSNFIRQKLISHFGFIIEAVIESIPQSILQMIFLIMYHSSASYSIINVLSIVMSMTVVSSKGTLLSYSIYRKASIFNFLCFAIDIFGIFTISAWLFVLDDNNNDNDEGGYKYQLFGYNLWYVAYYYFDMLYYIYKTLIWIAFWAFNLLLIQTYQQYWNCPWRNIIQIIFIPIGCVLLVIPVSLIVLTVRFTLIPVFLLQAFDHSQNRSYSFYNRIYSFMTDSKSIKEIHEKILITNWTLAQIIKQTESDTMKGRYLCDARGINTAETVCNEMEKQYEETGTVSLSNLYRTLKICDYNYWIHHKYHQCLELITLLITKKGFWQFLLIKISPKQPSTCYLSCIKVLFCCVWSTGDIDATFKWDIEKYKELEIEFWKTIGQILIVIEWQGFEQTLRRNWARFMIQLNLIRLWFNNLNWREVATAIGLLIAIVARDLFWKDFMKQKVPIFVKWVLNGLYYALLQDLANLYYSIMRIYDIIKNGSNSRYKSKNHIRSSLTLTEHIQFVNSPKVFKFYKNRQILKWNFPKCWSNWNVLFKNRVITNDSADSYLYFSNFMRYNQPWIGRGIFVFIVVIIFKCIHCPLRNLYTSRRFEDFCVCMVGIPAFIIILPLVLCIAIYSIFAPILFIIHQWIYFGLFNFDKNLLQQIFTVCYLIIFIAIFILLPQVWRFVYTNWHLYRYFTDKKPTPLYYGDHIVDVYHSTFIRDDLLYNCFGPDLSGLIKSYLPQYQIWTKQFY